MAKLGRRLTNRHFHQIPLNNANTTQVEIHKIGIHPHWKKAQNPPYHKTIHYLKPVPIITNYNPKSRPFTFDCHHCQKNNNRARTKTSSVGTFWCHLCKLEVPTATGSPQEASSILDLPIWVMPADSTAKHGVVGTTKAVVARPA